MLKILPVDQVLDENGTFHQRKLIFCVRVDVQTNKIH